MDNKMRRTKQSVTVDLEGPVLETILAKFRHLELQNELLIQQNKQNEELLRSVLSQLNTPKKVYTSAEIMKILNVSKRTLENYRNTGKIECYKVGKKVWFTQEQLDGFLKFWGR